MTKIKILREVYYQDNISTSNPITYAISLGRQATKDEQQELEQLGLPCDTLIVEQGDSLYSIEAKYIKHINLDSFKSGNAINKLPPIAIKPFGIIGKCYEIDYRTENEIVSIIKNMKDKAEAKTKNEKKERAEHYDKCKKIAKDENRDVILEVIMLDGKIITSIMQPDGHYRETVTPVDSYEIFRPIRRDYIGKDSMKDTVYYCVRSNKELFESDELDDENWDYQELDICYSYFEAYRKALERAIKESPSGKIKEDGEGNIYVIIKE